MHRLRRILRGLFQMVTLMVACTLLVFILQNLSGRNPGRSILGQYASQDAVNELNAKLGVDQPIFIQYFNYLGNLIQGDLGTSYYSATSVSEILADRMGATALLLILSFAISLIITFPLTYLSVRKPGGIADNVVRGFTLMGTVIPAFWLGILLILLIALPTGWFPVGGYGETFPEQLRSLFLPALTVAIGLAPVQIRTLRTSWLRAMGTPYVEAARSRGVLGRRLMISHALPNSVVPYIAIVAVQAGWSIFTAVIVENTFRIPGLGQGLVLAANQSDFPIVNATTLLMAFTVVVVSFLADWIMMFFDPKQRTSRS